MVQLVEQIAEADKFAYPLDKEFEYPQKLVKHQNKIIELITQANNAVQAGEDATQILNQINVLHTAHIEEFEAIKAQTLAIKEQTQSIALAEINGSDVDLNSLSINGADVTTALNNLSIRATAALGLAI